MDSELDTAWVMAALKLQKSCREFSYFSEQKGAIAHCKGTLKSHTLQLTTRELYCLLIRLKYDNLPHANALIDCIDKKCVSKIAGTLQDIPKSNVLLAVALQQYVLPK